jgi:chromosomal replication initiation ATPase DnaA
MTPRERNKERTLADIAPIAAVHGVSVEEILGKSRLANIVAARWDCFAMYRTGGKSTLQIGRIMGRDHSTVCHALQKMGWGGSDLTAGASAGLV